MQQLIQKVSQTWISPEHLESLKLQFRRQIDSPRLSARIRDLDELLYVLMQRDVLTEVNLQPLEKICKELRTTALIDEVQNFKYLKRHSIIDGTNAYASERIKEAVTVREDQNKSNNYPESYSKCKRDAIYKVIASDIGRKWREFGRYLGIKEGDMDDLDSQFPKDFKSKVYGLFKILEEDIDGRQRYVVILEALSDCRRHDLRRKLDEILNS